MSKKVFFVLFAVLMLAVITVSVFADQDGYDRFCNMDQYGCWNTNEEGGKDYIMFWSEAARTYFMGPGSNATVTDLCVDCNGKLGMGSGGPASPSAPARTWKDDMADMYNRHADYISSNWGIDVPGLIENQINLYEGQINNGNMTVANVEALITSFEEDIIRFETGELR